MSAATLDAFATLDLPRLAGLDEESIRSAYFRLSKNSEEQSSELNEAFNTLLAPEKRLKHLLDLQAPAEAKQWRMVPMSEQLMQHFMALGKVRPPAEALIEKRNVAKTALARAVLEGQTFAIRDEIEQIGTALDSQRNELVATLPALDALLNSTPDDPAAWRSLAEAQAHLSYLSKWQTQVRELLLKLM